MKKVLLKDIAERAGVSTTLVSFVLNDKDKVYRVGEETAKHIRKIAAEMNYTPNIAARSLRSGRTGIIGVVVSDISNPFFAHVARVIEDSAARMGYTVFFCSTDENTAKFKSVVWGLVNRGVEGLILVPCEDCLETIEQLVVNRVPLVLLDRTYDNLDVSSVQLNNRGATYTATRHLLDSGYVRIGMIAYDLNMNHMRERVEGYKLAMTEAGLADAINVSYVPMHEIESAAGTAVEMMMGDVDAFLFGNNTITLSALSYLNTLKPDVPGKLGLVGFDGNDAFGMFYSPLTYVRQPVEDIALKATELLVDKIANDSPARHLMLDGELVIASSSVR